MAQQTGQYQRPGGLLALGALEGLDAACLTIPVVGMNAMPEAITAIRAGRMLATVSFDAPALVCTTLMAALRLLEGEAVPEVVALPAEVIGRENCAEWDCSYEERPLPEWGSMEERVI